MKKTKQRITNEATTVKLQNIRNAVKDIIWMARRYANGRHTYAPELFNDAYDILRSELGDSIDIARALGDNGEPMYDISIEHSNIHPYAIDEDSTQQSDTIVRRKFFIKPERAR